MTIPYVPGWGDNIRANLDSLGQSLQKIIFPNRETEEILKQMLMKNPETINAFIEMERANPGSTGIFGKNFQSFVASSKFTPAYEQAKRIRDLNEQNLTLNLEQGKLATELAKARAPGEKVKAELFNKAVTALSNDSDSEFSKFALNKMFDLPTEGDFAAYNKTLEDINRAMELRQKGRAWLEANPNATPLSIAADFRKNKISTDDFEALYLANPNAVSEAFKYMSEQDAAKLRMALQSRESNLIQAAVLRNQMSRYATMSNDLRKRGYNVSASALALHDGFNKDVLKSIGLPIPSDEEVALVPEAVNSINTYQNTAVKSKALATLNALIRDVSKLKSERERRGQLDLIQAQVDILNSLPGDDQYVTKIDKTFRQDQVQLFKISNGKTTRVDLTGEVTKQASGPLKEDMLPQIHRFIQANPENINKLTPEEQAQYYRWLAVMDSTSAPEASTYVNPESELARILQSISSDSTLIPRKPQPQLKNLRDIVRSPTKPIAPRSTINPDLNNILSTDTTTQSILDMVRKINRNR